MLTGLESVLVLVQNNDKTNVNEVHTSDSLASLKEAVIRLLKKSHKTRNFGLQCQLTQTNSPISLRAM